MKTHLAALCLLVLAACDEPKSRGAGAAPTAPPAPAVAPGKSSSEGLPRLSQMPGFSIDRIGGVTDPYNHQPAETEIGQGIAFDGFGFDPVAKAPGRGVEVVVDGVAHPTAYGHDRTDVAAYFKAPALTQVGFTVTLPPTAMEPGAHTVVVRVIAADGRGYFESPSIAFVAR